MENFEFCNPTRIIFGRGTEARVGAETARYSQKVLLHYGSGSIKQTGLYDRITASLKAAGVEWVELAGVKPNPRLSLVHEGVALCKQHKLGLILAVGGGCQIAQVRGHGQRLGLHLKRRIRIAADDIGGGDGLWRDAGGAHQRVDPARLARVDCFDNGIGGRARERKDRLRDFGQQVAYFHGSPCIGRHSIPLW